MTPKIIPVIHYASDEQAMRNAKIAFDVGCEGVFLIHMDGQNELLSPIAQAIKQRWPDKLVGVNYLGIGVEEAISLNLDSNLDMTWTDKQITHSLAESWIYAKQIQEQLSHAPNHLLFMGVAFKYQSEEPNAGMAASKACELGFIPTTSGAATGTVADIEKIRSIRAAIGDTAPLAIASGITPENVHEYAPLLSHLLVATGVSSDFYELDRDKLSDLQEQIRSAVMPSDIYADVSDYFADQVRSDEPGFPKAGERLIHDWRTHVGENVQKIWREIPHETRLAIALDAQFEADHEEYE